MPGSNDDAELASARVYAPGHVAFCRLENIGAPREKCYVAQWLAYMHLCQRFTHGLTTRRA